MWLKNFNKRQYVLNEATLRSHACRCGYDNNSFDNVNKNRVKAEIALIPFVWNLDVV